MEGIWHEKLLIKGGILLGGITLDKLHMQIHQECHSLYRGTRTGIYHIMYRLIHTTEIISREESREATTRI